MKSIRKHLEIRWNANSGQEFTLQKQHQEFNLQYAEDGEEIFLFI
ncbi:hypothetical protein [Ulvibacterium sp.]|nr:hypothetical protein [Ulvibacterium sp.]